VEAFSFGFDHLVNFPIDFDLFHVHSHPGMGSHVDLSWDRFPCRIKYYSPADNSSAIRFGVMIFALGVVLGSEEDLFQ
jgi:hypothetical protein